ncbi:50S ribosomal protein L11, partial [Candidatus Pacearchaeota archaeon RBG_16_35_8]
MQIKLLVDGGSMAPGPALSQKLGPLGINVNQVIQSVNEATKNFKGLKVPVELEVDPSTKNFDVKVFSPPVSELLKKELGVAKGSGMQKKITIYNASIEQIISVAKTKLPNMLSKNLKAAVKTVVGTCGTLGVLVENKTAVEVEKEIDEGKYDAELKSEKTETPAEKRKKLDEYFFEIKEKQEKVLKAEQAAKEAAAQAAAPAEGAAATPTAEKTAEE